MKRSVLFVAAALAVVPYSTALAAKVKAWSHSLPAHYEKAQCKNAVITNEGVLRLSRQLQPYEKLAATHVWDIVEDQGGNLYVATGDEGKLFKVTPNGKAVCVFESDESQILC